MAWDFRTEYLDTICVADQHMKREACSPGAGTRPSAVLLPMLLLRRALPLRRREKSDTAPRADSQTLLSTLVITQTSGSSAVHAKIRPFPLGMNKHSPTQRPGTDVGAGETKLTSHYPDLRRTVSREHNNERHRARATGRIAWKFPAHSRVRGRSTVALLPASECLFRHPQANFRSHQCRPTRA